MTPEQRERYELIVFLNMRGYWRLGPLTIGLAGRWFGWRRAFVLTRDWAGLPGMGMLAVWPVSVMWIDHRRKLAILSDRLIMEGDGSDVHPVGIFGAAKK
jgi:hypothetical protein